MAVKPSENPKTEAEDAAAHLSPDKPLIDPEDDKLGYAPFALHLSRSIAAMIPPEGLVMALYGPWGSGKSTVLGFVERYVQDVPAAQRPVIVRFNPWWFSGHADLAEKFFGQLELALGRKKSLEKLRKRLADLATTVAKAKGIIPYAGAGDVVAELAKPPTKDVPRLKEEIGKFLLEEHIRLLIIVDDVDRLSSAEEVRQVFRVIKAVADFPNALYLLAFDKEMVVQALDQPPGVPGSGEAFLEKIVQVPFDLPLPDRAALRALLSEKLDGVLAGTPASLFPAAQWINTYFDGIDHFIQTPRDVMRLANSLRLTYPAVQGEVNPVDFIALEVLRLACPSVYDTVRRNPDMFAGNTDADRFSNGDERLKQFHEAWLSSVVTEHRQAAKSLVARLFPKAAKTWSNMGYGADWESRWRRELRACSPDVFPVYFRLTLPAGTLSRQDMETLLSKAEDASAFSEHLLALAGEARPAAAATKRIWNALDRLQDFTEEHIPEEHIRPILTALFNVADTIIGRETGVRGRFNLGIDVQFARIFWQLARRLPEPDRFRLLSEVFSTGAAVEFIVQEIATMGQEHGKLSGKAEAPEEMRLVTGPHLAELERIGLRRIEALASDGTLQTARSIVSLLYRWRDWGGEAEPRLWVERLIQRDEGLLALLEAALNQVRTQALDEVYVETQYVLDPATLEPFLPADGIATRVGTLTARNDLSERQQAAVHQFLKRYDQ